MWKNHKAYSAKFKLNVVLEILNKTKTQAQITSEYGIHPTQQSKWKKQFLDQAESVFSDKRKKDNQDNEKITDNLYKKIGQLSYEIDWLQKKTGINFDVWG